MQKISFEKLSYDWVGLGGTLADANQEKCVHNINQCMRNKILPSGLLL